MTPKRNRDNLSDYDTNQEDLNVESVGEILDGFEVVFDSNEEKVKILQDRHKTFENATDIPAEGSSVDTNSSTESSMLAATRELIKNTRMLHLTAP